MNLIALFRLRGSSLEREVVRIQHGTEFAKGLVKSSGGPDRVTLLVGIDEPREMNLHREGDDYSPPFDFAIKAVLPSDKAFLEQVRVSGLEKMSAQWSAYQVEETVKKERGNEWHDGELPGVHMLHPLYFHEDLPKTVLLRSWREIHGDLALRVHVGANMYRQHLVENVVMKASAPVYGGFSEFHFPNREALLTGYFDSDRGRLEIRHDIRHFIKGFPSRLFAKEYRVSRK